MKVQSTEDYGMFKFLKGNRAVGHGHVRKLTKSILSKNMLNFYPILVNKNMEIIDGQHRLKVAKDNNLTIYYSIINEADIHDVHALNDNVKKWSAMEYVQSYAQLGNSNYKTLIRFKEDNDLTLQVTLAFLFGSAGGNTYRALKNEKFEITAEMLEQAQVGANFYNKLKKYWEQGTVESSSEIKFLAFAINNILKAGLDAELLEVLEKHNIKIQPSHNRIGYLRQFEEILNYKKQTKLKRLF